MISNLTNYFSENPKRLFLLDGLGALLTAGMLGLVLANYEVYFGMPAKILHILATFACLLALYSICCSLLLKAGFQPYLWVIGIANLAYCCVTLGLIICYFQQLTLFGISYFLLEIVIIISLAYIELGVYAILKSIA